jgi:hypothetical protein
LQVTGNLDPSVFPMVSMVSCQMDR